MLSFYEGVGVLKIEESESELLCTDSTALPYTTTGKMDFYKYWSLIITTLQCNRANIRPTSCTPCSFKITCVFFTSLQTISTSMLLTPTRSLLLEMPTVVQAVRGFQVPIRLSSSCHCYRVQLRNAFYVACFQREDHHLSYIRDCVFNIFSEILHARCFSPPSAPLGAIYMVRR
jgi:hypothetical protein